MAPSVRKAERLLLFHTYFYTSLHPRQLEKCTRAAWRGDLFHGHWALSAQVSNKKFLPLFGVNLNFGCVCYFISLLFSESRKRKYFRLNDNLENCIHLHVAICAFFVRVLPDWPGRFIRNAKPPRVARRALRAHMPTLRISFESAC